MFQDFIAALRFMEEPMIAFGIEEVRVFSKTATIEQYVQDANIYLAMNKSESKIVKYDETYIFLDYDNMTEAQKEEAKQIES